MPTSGCSWCVQSLEGGFEVGESRSIVGDLPSAGHRRGRHVAEGELAHLVEDVGDSQETRKGGAQIDGRAVSLEEGCRPGPDRPWPEHESSPEILELHLELHEVVERWPIREAREVEHGETLAIGEDIVRAEVVLPADL